MANNKERYGKIFVEALGLTHESVNEDLVYNSVPSWDSVGHMTLMAALETEFDIMLETDDIIAFSSYGKGMEILARYGVEIMPGAAVEATA
jgi:acyl carrier protein